MRPRLIIVLMLTLILLQIPILLFHEWNHHDPHDFPHAEGLSAPLVIILSGKTIAVSDN